MSKNENGQSIERLFRWTSLCSFIGSVLYERFAREKRLLRFDGNTTCVLLMSIDSHNP